MSRARSSDLRRARVLVILALVLMAAVYLYGCLAGGFLPGFLLDMKDIFQRPWGRVILVEIYAGFCLFCAWVIFRERSLPRKIIWVVLILAVGNIVSCIYVLAALQGCRGDWNRFWYGPPRPDGGAGP